MELFIISNEILPKTICTTGFLPSSDQLFRWMQTLMTHSLALLRPPKPDSNCCGKKGHTTNMDTASSLHILIPESIVTLEMVTKLRWMSMSVWHCTARPSLNSCSTSMQKEQRNTNIRECG
jgi:hypothetical protein